MVSPWLVMRKEPNKEIDKWAKLPPAWQAWNKSALMNIVPYRSNF
jgi:hypothetical protein